MSRPCRSGVTDLPSAIRKFRRLKRGYYSFLIILAAYVFSFFLPLVMSGTALLVQYNGGYYFPMSEFHSVTEFGIEDSASRTIGS